MMLWLIDVCGRPLTTRRVCGAGRFAVTAGRFFAAVGSVLAFALAEASAFGRLRRWLLAGHRLCDGRRGRRLCFGCVFRGRCLLRRLLFGIGADDLRLRLRLRSLAYGAPAAR